MTSAPLPHRKGASSSRTLDQPERHWRSHPSRTRGRSTTSTTSRISPLATSQSRGSAATNKTVTWFIGSRPAAARSTSRVWGKTNRARTRRPCQSRAQQVLHGAQGVTTQTTASTPSLHGPPCRRTGWTSTRPTSMKARRQVQPSRRGQHVAVRQCRGLRLWRRPHRSPSPSPGPYPPVHNPCRLPSRRIAPPHARHPQKCLRHPQPGH